MLAILCGRTDFRPCLYISGLCSSLSHLFFVSAVAFIFSRLLTRQETESEISSPENLATLSDKDGCCRLT
jgi:hypothetical protein